LNWKETPVPHDSTADILIVDDLPENLLALDALIRDAGRRIFQASSADDALSLLLEREFALAILDVQMPGMNGFEMAELMRGTERTRHIPIVFVSAAGRELNYAFTGYESGAVDFLYKPLDPYAVRSKVSVFVDLYLRRKETLRQMGALQQARAEQEALLGELQATQAQLQRAVKMRDDFMSMVSHELRTPLNTLGLESQMRRMHIQRGTMPGADQWKAMVERDERQIRSMLRLIDDMLDVSRLRSNGTLSITPAPIDLKLLLERVVDVFSAQMGAANCSLSLHAPASVNGVWDEYRIEQVVANLLTNAERYGAGKPVQVCLFTIGDMAVVEVRDEGIGISQEDQSRIFDQFERVTPKNVAAGLGLGLYITRQIVQAHGGDISVSSRPGVGSTFTMRLPLRVEDRDDQRPALA
jgi:signal transduction histidine kinase